MKKQFLTLSLICSISLMGMESFVPEIPTKPTLKSVLVKKYVQKKPLTKQEQAYLSKTSKRAIAAGLAALGIAVVGRVGYTYAKPSPKRIFAKYNVELSKDARDLVNASDLNTILRIKEYRVKYDTLMMDPNFRKALAEARGVAVKDLPTYFYSFN